MRKLVIASLVAIALLLAPVFWLFWQGSVAHRPGSAVEVMIPKGASSIRIARMLQQADVISSALAFRFAVRLDGSAQALKSGLYYFEGDASIQDVINRLVAGDVMRFQVTVPEGLRNDEVLGLLAEKSGMALEQWQQAFSRVVPGGEEGMLLPETYQYTKPLDPSGLLGSMRRAQQQLLNELTPDATVQARLRIAASIIEKETRLDAERPLVSAVIRNRLSKGMPLQMDPTVIYGIWKTTGSFSGNIHRQDLTHDTPWNTYTRRGLPPTPIGNPGGASLRAAARPADVDYLYFVADGSGGHKFAATLAEHDANVKAWVQFERSHDASR